MSKRTGIRRTRVFHWIWVLGAIAPLALVGCQGNRSAQNNQNGPVERVAGERSDNDVAQVLQSAGLPETFAFGARMWKGHQVHHVTKDKIATIPANPPGPDRNVGDNSGDAAKNTFDFMPVADLMVQGHQIYRKSGLDEALTDNIFLMADNGTSSDGKTDVAFVEYDAADDLMKNTELAQDLKAADLQPTISAAGKAWTAKKMQEYDPDVFDKVKRLPDDINGHAAYQGDKKDEVFLSAELPANMSQDTTTGTRSGTGTDTAAEGSTMSAGGTDKMPVFFLYQVEGSPPGPKGAK